MGMFFDKLMESADAIQSPGNVGVDLDAVADNIMGDDGIEAHRDEVEAAADGVVGDPVEEAAVIMYESEYNYNQLMKRIGIVELQEASHGRDFILEGADTKGFFNKVKDTLVSMFKRITEVFKSIFNKLTSSLSTDKALATKYAEAIKEGCKRKDEWEFNGYEIKDIDYNPANTTLAADCIKALEAAAKGETPALPSNIEICNAETKPFGITISADDKSAAAEMAKALEAKLFVKKKYGMGGDSISADTIINILKNDRETKAIRKNYDNVKKAYKEALGELKKIQTAIDSKYASVSTAFGIANHYVRALTYQKNVQHKVFALSLKAARVKRSQARRMALMWQKIGYRNGVGTKGDDKGNGQQPVNASAILNIDII